MDGTWATCLNWATKRSEVEDFLVYIWRMLASLMQEVIKIEEGIQNNSYVQLLLTSSAIAGR